MLVKHLAIRIVMLAGTFLLALNIAQAQSSSVQFSTGMAGIGTEAPNILSVALPIQNVGTAAAQNVQVTAISLASSTLLTSTNLPIQLGTISEDGIATVNAQFDLTPLTPKASYRMTVTGRYVLGGTPLGFSVSRNIIIPLSSPGGSPLGSSTVHSTIVVNPPKLPLPSNLPPDEPESRNFEWPPVPTGRRQILFPEAFTTSQMGEQRVQIPGGGAPTVSFGTDTSYGRSGGTPVDPSGAASGNVVLTTGNTYASISIDGGKTFTNVNPFCMFGYVNCDALGNPVGSPLVDGNLCCDQVIQYVPAINRFIWLMQTWPTNWINGVRTDARGNPIASGTNRLRVVSVSPEDVRSWAAGGASSWIVFDLGSATFGLAGANDWMDYPDMSVGNNFLYVSVDKMVASGGLMVARMPLNQLSAVGTINIDYTKPEDINGRAHGSHVTQNTGNAVYWAGHNKVDKLTVFSMLEGENRFSWRDVSINDYTNTTYTSKTPTIANWLGGSNGFGLENIQGALRVPNAGLCPPEGCPPDELWFAWGAGADNTRGRPEPYVEVVHIDSQNFSVKTQMHIWNSSYAFAYPAFATNSNREVGVAIAVGGSDREAHTSVGFMGDFLVWALSNSDNSISRYGDYLTVRKSDPNGRLFSAVGYGRITGIGFDPHYVTFGRFCDVQPEDRTCIINLR